MGQPSASTIPVENESSPPPYPLRMLARTWLGGVALAWDELSALAHAPGRIVERGEALERSLASQWRRLADQARAGSERLTASMRAPIDWVAGGVHEGGAFAEEELERQIEQALDRLGIPSRERLRQLGDEIDALAERIDAELARQAV